MNWTKRSPVSSGKEPCPRWLEPPYSFLKKRGDWDFGPSKPRTTHSKVPVSSSSTWGKLNPYLESTLRMAASFYAEAAITNVPLWESRVDHSSTIRRVTGSELLAELQAGWANIIRTRPAFGEFFFQHVFVTPL